MGITVASGLNLGLDMAGIFSIQEVKECCQDFPPKNAFTCTTMIGRKIFILHFALTIHTKKESHFLWGTHFIISFQHYCSLTLLESLHHLDILENIHSMQTLSGSSNFLQDNSLKSALPALMFHSTASKCLFHFIRIFNFPSFDVVCMLFRILSPVQFGQV